MFSGKKIKTEEYTNKFSKHDHYAKEPATCPAAGDGSQPVQLGVGGGGGDPLEADGGGGHARARGPSSGDDTNPSVENSAETQRNIIANKI